MGYTTEFDGNFKLSRPASPAELAFINTFSSTRRMARNVSTLMTLFGGKFGLPNVNAYKPTAAQAKAVKSLISAGYAVTEPVVEDKRTAAQIYGIEGEYFAKDDGNYGQSNDKSVIDHNKEPKTQPGLWCQWELNETGTELRWNGGEKFYHYTEWLQYMINNFFAPWGIILNGEVTWEGEDSSDLGKIVVADNNMRVLHGEVSYR